MTPPKEEFGTRKDLVLYRIQTSKNTLKSAEIFPREIGRKISESEKIRHASDYDAMMISI